MSVWPNHHSRSLFINIVHHIMWQEMISHRRKHDKPTCCRPMFVTRKPKTQKVKSLICNMLILALLRIINTAAKRWTSGNEEHCCMQQERRALKHRSVMWDFLSVRGKVSLTHLFSSTWDWKYEAHKKEDEHKTLPPRSCVSAVERPRCRIRRLNWRIQNSNYRLLHLDAGFDLSDVHRGATWGQFIKDFILAVDCCFLHCKER